jgi:hypothetical protein
MVGARLLAALDGHATYASSPSWDGKWLSVLLRGAGLPRHALRLRDTDEAQWEAATGPLAALLAGEALEAAARAIVDRVRQADDGAPVAHRALPDARHELWLWSEIGRAAKAEAAALSER